jgi:hypothetical protein
MKEQVDLAIELIKKQEIDGCITGSCLAGYWADQDVDVFLYTKASFDKILYYMYYNPMFQVLDPLEKHKLEEYINEGKSSLKKIGLITIKFKYNLCVDVNIIYKEYQHTVFDILANFDIDLIAKGYDIRTKQVLDLRQSKDLKVTWNRWNTSFYKSDFWSTRRLLRQFERVIKYTERGFDLSEVTDKYIELVEDILKKEDIYKTERGHKFYEDTMEQFEVVLKILKEWKSTNTIGEAEKLVLKTLI